MAEEDVSKKEKSILENFKEAYPGCLEGFVEDVYVKELDSKPAVFCCSIRQAIVSKPKIALLEVDSDLYIPPVGLTKGHRVSFLAVGGESNFLIGCDGSLVAVLNHTTGNDYYSSVYKSYKSIKYPLECLKWENISEPL